MDENLNETTENTEATTEVTTNTENNEAIKIPNIPIEAIKKTIAGTTTSNYLTKSGVYAGSVIDEIVEIDIILADVFSFVGSRRKFAIFGEVKNGGDSTIINRGNYSDYIVGLTNNNTKNIIVAWFNMGGVELTIININKIQATIQEPEPRVGTAIEFEGKNLIFVGLTKEEQLATYELYKNYNKRFFLTKNTADDYTSIPKARNNFIFLKTAEGLDGEMPLVDYLAKYTVDNYYNKNSFAVSNKTGIKLQSTDYLISNNVGGLIVIDDNQQSIYYNMVDTEGYDLNLDFLFDDLHDKIQINTINTLKIDNTYNQTTINRIDEAIKKAALYFVDLKRIGGFTQSLIPFKNQEVEDIKAGIAKGFVLKYQALTEIKKAKIAEIEVIGNL
jgi:hypothetical protein